MGAELPLSITGTVLSVASLAWQFVSWRRSGPVVTVRVGQSLPIVQGSATDWYVHVTAHNTGRAPVTVTGWGLRLPGGESFILPNNVRFADTLPYRLEAHSSGTWYIPTEEVKRLCADHHEHHQNLTGYVTLATGATVISKQQGIGLK